MTRLTSLDLTPFYRNAVGFDSLFDRMTANIDMAASSVGKTIHPMISFVPVTKPTEFKLLLQVSN